MRIVQGNSSTPKHGSSCGSPSSPGRLLTRHRTSLNLATPNPVDGSFIYNIDRYINLHEQAINDPTVATAGENFNATAAAP